jgi:hypothetical protein
MKREEKLDRMRKAFPVINKPSLGMGSQGWRVYQVDPDGTAAVRHTYTIQEQAIKAIVHLERKNPTHTYGIAMSFIANRFGGNLVLFDPDGNEMPDVCLHAVLFHFCEGKIEMYSAQVDGWPKYGPLYILEASYAGIGNVAKKVRDSFNRLRRAAL